MLIFQLAVVQLGEYEYMSATARLSTLRVPELGIVIVVTLGKALYAYTLITGPNNLFIVVA